MDKVDSIQWYTLTMEYYSVLQRNELSSHERTWKNLMKTTDHLSRTNAFAYFTHPPKSIKGPEVKNPHVKFKVVLHNPFSHYEIHRNNDIFTAHWDKLKGI